MFGTRSQARKRSLEQRSPDDSDSIRSINRTLVVKKHPLDLLPEEGWGLVFAKVDPDDLISCCKVGISFRSWLESKRTKFLAHKVIPLLNLTTAEKLTCRKVCRSWRAAVDLDCETKAFADAEYMRYGFKTTKDLEIWRERMLARPLPEANPFISRNVMFSSGAGLEWNARNNRAAEFRAYWNGVAELLEMYGEHIWYLKLVYYPSGNFDVVEQKQSICRLLTLLPNLKGLGVCRPGLCGRERLQPSIPPIPHLCRLEFTSPAFDPIKTELLRTCDPLKLEHLKISTDDAFGMEGWEPLTTFNNLKRLDLGDRYFNLIPRLKAVDWPLQELSLHVILREFWSPTHTHDYYTASFSKVSRWVNKFGGTLRSLTLCFLPTHCPAGGSYYNKKSTELRLTLPRLQNLTIIKRFDVGGVLFLDFIEELQALEELTLDINNGKAFQIKPNPNEKIKFCGYEKRMLKSNVWELLPKLWFIELKNILGAHVYRKPERMPTNRFVKQLGSSPFELYRFY